MGARHRRLDRRFDRKASSAETHIDWAKVGLRLDHLGAGIDFSSDCCRRLRPRHFAVPGLAQASEKIYGRNGGTRGADTGHLRRKRRCRTTARRWLDSARPGIARTRRVATRASRLLSGQSCAPGGSQSDRDRPVQIEPRVRTGTGPPRPRVAGVAFRLRRKRFGVRPNLVRLTRNRPAHCRSIRSQRRKNQSSLMNKRIPLILLTVFAALFIGGLVQLFRLRFEAGDVYPAYSSLRADPLGTRAFYESLARMPDVTVRRDYSRANRLPETKAAAYLHLAARVHDWRTVPEEIFKEAEAFAIRGGRLVVTLLSETRDPSKLPLGYRLKEEPPTPAKPDEDSSKKGSPPDQPDKKQKSPRTEQPRVSRRVALRERWGVEFAFLPLEKQRDGTYQSTAADHQGTGGLAKSLSWHSGVVFTNLHTTWRVIYSRGSHPVLIERRFGSGSVVFATDSYFVSNQAMREERHADLLAWLVGPSKQVVFDEAHLGVLEDPGVATLVRKYQLHGVVATLVLLAALFIWKNSASLVPPYSDEVREAHVSGKESAVGFVNLLRRNLATRDVLNACHAEWIKSFAHGTIVSPAKQERIKAVLDAENALPAKQRNAVKAYQAIAKILSHTIDSELGTRNSKPPQ